MRVAGGDLRDVIDTLDGRGQVADLKVVADGTHRVRTFAQTWATVRPTLRAMGITRIANVTGLDDLGVPVVMVCRPNGRSLAVTQGKGLTLEAARLSGVMEAAELFHAEELDLPAHDATPDALAAAGSRIEIERLARHLDAQLVGDRPVRWVQGTSLVSGQRRWVPYECVQVGRIRHWDRTFQMGTSGLACGNTLGEAVSHAICELAERHAQAVWNALPRALQATTRVDLDSVGDRACRRLLTRLARAGAAVGVWNLTCEIGLPTFTCAIVQPSTRYARAVPPAAGSGCHPDRAVALARAITEAAQSRLTHIVGARDDMSIEQYTVLAGAASIRRTLDLIRAGEPAPFDRIESWSGRHLTEDIELELRLLARAGYGEAVTVELTRPDLRLPVVRVLIPGLEHPPPPAHLVPRANGARA